MTTSSIQHLWQCPSRTGYPCTCDPKAVTVVNAQLELEAAIEFRGATNTDDTARMRASAERIWRACDAMRVAILAEAGVIQDGSIPSDTVHLDEPITDDFWSGVRAEMAHQIRRWGTTHDKRKEPADWFWVLGYLGGKALAAHVAGNREKALHHTISSAAVLAHWHEAIKHGGASLKVEHDPSRELGERLKGTTPAEGRPGLVETALERSLDKLDTALVAWRGWVTGRGGLHRVEQDLFDASTPESDR